MNVIDIAFDGIYRNSKHQSIQPGIIRFKLDYWHRVQVMFYTIYQLNTPYSIDMFQKHHYDTSGEIIYYCNLNQKITDEEICMIQELLTKPKPEKYAKPLETYTIDVFIIIGKAITRFKNKLRKCESTTEFEKLKTDYHELQIKHEQLKTDNAHLKIELNYKQSELSAEEQNTKKCLQESYDEQCTRKFLTEEDIEVACMCANSITHAKEGAIKHAATKKRFQELYNQHFM
jgi:hypothetical protein